MSEDNSSKAEHEIAPFTLGVAGVHSIPNKSTGGNVRFYYNPSAHICFGPEFSYLTGSGHEIVDVDFVIHYIVMTPVIDFYPVIGLNYTREISHGHSENSAGLLYGAGMHKYILGVMPFVEYTRIAGHLNDEFLTAGVMIGF